MTPSLPNLDTVTKRQDYIVPPKPAVVNYEKPVLRPIGMKAEKKQEVYNGFVKAGAGVPTSFYGEAGYYLHPGDNFDAKAWIRHHSANAKSLENQRFFNNDVRLNTNIYLANKLVVQGDAAYSFDRIHYYGYNHDSLSYPEEGVRQDYKLFTLGGKLFNGERNDADINYFIEPKIYFLRDFFSNSENGLDLKMGGTKWFADKHALNLAIRADMSTFNDTAKQKLNNIYLQPSFVFHNDFLRFKVGGNFASNRDVFYLFPDAELSLRILGDGLQLFAGASGDLRKNTYRSITEYNPFIQMRGSSIMNTQYRDYFAGIRGNLGWLEYTGKLAYANARDMALYQSSFDNTGITRFQVLYDTVNIFSIQGTVKLIPFEGFTLGGTVGTSVFSPSNQEHAWGIPALETNVNAIYSLLDGKAQLKGNLYLADQIFFNNPEGQLVKTGALVDLSFGGSYYFTKNIGVFLDINNLLNNKRQRWLDYPTFGLNVLGGVTARF
ncbi:MAG: hypothetical protein IPL65_13820 [Lewinellaceae bacterium]|nr:hypothetical protein [Lewinellaceae bacterium]